MALAKIVSNDKPVLVPNSSELPITAFCLLLLLERMESNGIVIVDSDLLRLGVAAPWAVLEPEGIDSKDSLPVLSPAGSPTSSSDSEGATNCGVFSSDPSGSESPSPGMLILPDRIDSKSSADDADELSLSTAGLPPRFPDMVGATARGISAPDTGGSETVSLGILVLPERIDSKFSAAVGDELPLLGDAVGDELSLLGDGLDSGASRVLRTARLPAFQKASRPTSSVSCDLEELPGSVETNFSSFGTEGA